MSGARDFDAISLSANAFWSAPPATRHAALKALRDHRPVSWQPPLERSGGAGRPYWAVVRHADIAAVSRDPEAFVSGRGVQIDDVPMPLQRRAFSILALDPPDHTKLRGVVQATFSPPQVARLEAAFARRARQIVDELIERGPCDFVENVANRLPVWAISELLGVPEDQRDALFHAANIFAGRADPEFVCSDEDIIRSLEFLEGSGRDLMARRRAEPAHDLVSHLVSVRPDGEPLQEDEILPMIVVLILGGADNIRHTISYGMHALCRFPDQRASLASDFERWIRPASDEFVRWGTSTPTMRRTCVREAAIAGVAVEPGEAVVLFYNSGNRDERAFTDPYAFDIARERNPHQGFGAGGPHYCIGSHLGRAEMRAIFRELLTRLPGLEVEEPDYYVGDVLQGIKRMRCSF